MAVYYIQINVICMILLLGILSILTGKKNFLPAQRVAFRRLIILALLICISDMGAWMCQGKNFPVARGLTIVFNMIYFFSVTATCYAWLSYVNICLEKTAELKNRTARVLEAAPMWAMTLVMLLTPFTGFLFRINDQAMYERGPGIIVHWIVSWMYLMLATCKTLYAMKHTSSRLERETIRPMLWFIIMPAVAAIAQMVAYGMTTLQCGITLSILMIAFSMIRDQVSNDALTGLNNRRAFNNFMEEKLQRSVRRSYTIFFVDIDKFKSINDTYGHSTGDIALQRVATVLKKTCGSCNVPLFLCRYGGDEFVLTGTELKPEETAWVLDNILENLRELNETLPEEMRLTLSIGTAEGVCDTEPELEALLVKADNNMYADKQQRGVARR